MRIQNIDLKIKRIMPNNRNQESYTLTSNGCVCENGLNIEFTPTYAVYTSKDKLCIIKVKLTDGNPSLCKWLSKALHNNKLPANLRP